MKTLTNTDIVLTPVNDPEALTIKRLLEAFNIAHITSNQPHGAKLELEDNLVNRIKSANPGTQNVVIVEIPGPKIERQLEELGYQIHIIDHHRYEDLDRSKDKSSLEQFLEYFEITDNDLTQKGFDPALIKSVGYIDHGFVWRMKEQITDLAKQKEILDHYRNLIIDLEGGAREEQEKDAQLAFENKEIRDNYLIFRQPREDIGIRDALSFLIAEKYEKPQPNIIIASDRIAVQDTDRAIELFESLGGYTYGGDKCFGKRGRGEDLYKEVAEVIFD